MRNADVLILPTIEEGSALVTYEARGSGCVLLVSNAAGAICTHGVDGLIHKVGDVAVLAEHISMLHADCEKLNRLRSVSLTTVDKLTWRFAGCHLFFVYAQVVDDCSRAGEEMR
jgi:glycosyltransferase involved in cell wall biosynthesis